MRRQSTSALSFIEQRFALSSARWRHCSHSVYTHVDCFASPSFYAAPYVSHSALDSARERLAAAIRAYEACGVCSQRGCDNKKIIHTRIFRPLSACASKTASTTDARTSMRTFSSNRLAFISATSLSMSLLKTKSSSADPK